jgi:outer membrane protein assembly factor BamA
MIGGIEFAHKSIQTVIDAIDELVSKCGVTKQVFESPAKPAIYETVLKNHADEFKQAGTNGLRYGAGVGLRYDTPVGPLRLDYGIKLNPLRGEPSGVLHFTVGQAF